MELFYSCDRVVSGDLNPNLPIADIQDLNEQMNWKCFVVMQNVKHSTR